jgi:hypothetical protein
MSRLRVGDIEIDGSNITIGGVPQIPTQPTAPIPGPPSTGPGVAMIVRPAATPAATSPGATRPAAAESLDGLANLPIGHRLLVGAGGGLAAAAVTLLVVTQAVAGMPLLFSGLGAIIVGLLKKRAVGRRAAARAREQELELGGHAERLRPLLCEGKIGKTEQTIEWITARSGLPEGTVVRTLAFMRDRQEVAEELNTETGEWYYAPALSLPAASLALDERLAALEGKDRKP